MKLNLIICLFLINFYNSALSMLILNDKSFLSDKVCQAIEDKDEKTLTELLKNPKNFHGIDEESQDTPLIMAIKTESMEIIKLLLKHHFIRKTINDFGKDYATALFWAKVMQDKELIELLQENGAIDDPDRLCTIL